VQPLSVTEIAARIFTGKSPVFLLVYLFFFHYIFAAFIGESVYQRNLSLLSAENVVLIIKIYIYEDEIYILFDSVQTLHVRQR